MNVYKSGTAGTAGKTGVLPGSNGTAGGAGGNASASITVSADALNIADATGGLGGGGGGGTARIPGTGGAAGAGGKGGNASAIVSTTRNSAQALDNRAYARGGAGGVAGTPGNYNYSGAYTIGAGATGGAGGTATGSSSATNKNGLAQAATTLAGGNGGSSIGPGKVGGAGGLASGGTAAAHGLSASASVTQVGGNGGAGHWTAEGGAGADSSLVNAVTGSAAGGYLQLAQHAIGGWGAQSFTGTGGLAGAATSTLTFNDTTNPVAASAVTVQSKASAGHGGGGAIGRAGGSAVAAATVTAIKGVTVSVDATGGQGGGSAEGQFMDGSPTAPASGAVGGAATAEATAISLNEAATATATALGNAGGAGWGAGKSAGAGGVASVTKVSAQGKSAYATATQTGGAGGYGASGAAGGAGAASHLTNLVTGGAKGGTLSLSQVAQGGAGGQSYKGAGGGGGAASSSLSFDDVAVNAGQASNLTGVSNSKGGTAGSGVTSGAAGAALSAIALNGAGTIKADALAYGGAGDPSTTNSNVNGAAGGAATATSLATSTTKTELVTAYAFTRGGGGGAGTGIGKTGGSGGVASGTTAQAKGHSAIAHVHQVGGAGGYGSDKAAGGAGAASSLTDAVTGSTSGGYLTLKQNAVGGGGGLSASATGGAGGSAASSLSFNDVTANAIQAGTLTGIAMAQAGLGGSGQTNGGQGGNAQASVTLTGAGIVDALAQAFGGASGQVELLGTGKTGGTATAAVTATSTSPTGSAKAEAFSVGGLGGNGAGTGKVGGVGGVASATTASASGHTASAYVRQTGGAGGSGYANANGGAGAASGLNNAVTGSTSGGDLVLSQHATGGAGGYGRVGGAGGGATSSLTFNDEAANATDAASLTLTSKATGGAGGDGSVAKGTGGAATADGSATAVRHVTTYAHATGGAGSATGGAATATGHAKSTQTTGPMQALARAYALGGSGTKYGSATSLATAETLAGGEAESRAQSKGGAGQARAVATTWTTGLVTKVVAEGVAVVNGLSSAGAAVSEGGVWTTNPDANRSAYAHAIAAPTAILIDAALSTNTKVNTVLGTDLATVVGYGMQGGQTQAGSVTGLAYESSATWSLNTTSLSGDLVLGMVGSTLSGTGFQSMTLTVSIEGVTAFTQTFTSGSAGATTAFFNNKVLNLGDVAQDADLGVKVSFTAVGGGAGTGYGFTYLLGTTNDEPDTIAPAMPTTPDLVDAYDTGISPNDNLTLHAQPTFQGKAEANATVTLFSGATVVGSAKASKGGEWLIAPDAPLTDGAHAITVKATDAAGNGSVSSAVLTVTIDTTPPAPPSAPDLDGGSDAGASNGDHITNVRTPVLTGTAEAHATITLYDNDAEIGTTNAGGNGSWSIQTSALADGVHNLKVRATDQAGNTGEASAALAITVDTVLPTIRNTLDLATASDHGDSSTDNLTNTKTPLISGKGDAFSSIQLFHGAMLIGSGTADATGAWSIATNTLGDGTYAIHAVETDLAGNVGFKAGAVGGGSAVSFADFTAPVGLTMVGDAAIVGSVLRVAPTGAANSGAAYVAAPVALAANGAFSTSFQFSLNDSSGADGFTFFVANNTTGLGVQGGYSLGYLDLFNSIAVEFDNYNNGGTDPNDNHVGVDVDGSLNTLITGTPTTRLDNGNIWTANITYDGVALTVQVQDGANAPEVVINKYGIDLVSHLGGTTAFLGFTASTGAAGQNHDILNWSFATGGSFTPLTITIDSIAPSVPSTPDLPATSDSGASKTDNVTSAKTATFTGTADANTTVTLWDGAVSIGSVKASAGGIWTITPAALTEGAHSLSTTAADAAGNVTASASVLALTTDYTAPVAPTGLDLIAASDSGSSATDNLTNDATSTIVGKAEAGATIRLFDGATEVGTGKANGAGVWSITTTALVDGSHGLRARATDLAGNISVQSALLTVVVDTALPAIPALPDLAAASDTGVSDSDNVTGDTTPSFIGTADANTTVTLLDGASVIGSAKADAAGAWSITTGPLAAGVHAIAVTATRDGPGNTSAPSAVLSVTIDAAAPDAPTTPDLADASDLGESSTDNLTAHTTPTFQGKAEARATVTLFDGATKIGGAVADNTGAWSIVASTLAAGVHAITAQATDAAGNVGAASASLAVTVEVTPPPAPSVPDLYSVVDTGTSNTDNVTRINTPLFTGKAEANATVTLLDGATVVGTGKASGIGNWSIKTAALGDGTHSIRAVVTDMAGNVGAASAALVVTIDTAAPAVSSLPNLTASSDKGRSAIDDITNVTTPLFIGTAEAGATVTLLAGGVTLGSTKVPGTGNWSIMTGALTDGKYAIATRVTDLAGNISAFSGTLAVTIDTVAPGTPVITGVTTAAITGSAEPLAQVTLFDGTTSIGSAITQANGLWSLPFALSAGTHALTAQATDRAGNAGAVSASVSAVIGTAAADALTGTAGADLMAGGAGDDTYQVDHAGDVVSEAAGGGSDTILASVSHTLGAAAQIEFLQAAAGAAELALTGNALANTITGGDGADVITGGGSADLLSGGLGADVFALLTLTDSRVALSGRDTIADFSALAGDLIGLSALDANTALAGDQAFTFIGNAAFSAAGQVRAEVVGGNTIVSGNVDAVLGADFSVALTGAHALNGGHFQL